MDVDDLLIFEGEEDVNIEDDDSSSINGFHGCYAADRPKNSIRTGNFVYFYDFYADTSKASEHSPKTDSSPEMFARNSINTTVTATTPPARAQFSFSSSSNNYNHHHHQHHANNNGGGVRVGSSFTRPREAAV